MRHVLPRRTQSTQILGYVFSAVSAVSAFNGCVPDLFSSVG